MADAPMVISDLAINPEKVNDYLGYFYNDKWEAFAAGWAGAIVNMEPSDEVLPGQVIKSPMFAMVKAATKLDVTNTAAVSTTAAPTSVLPYGPVCSNIVSPVEYFAHAARAFKKSGREIESLLGEQMAKRIVNARKLDILYAIRGAIGAMTTSTHVNDESSNSTKTAELTDLMDTKQLLGDAQDMLRVHVMHSKVWTSVKKDLVTGSNYNIERIGDIVVMGNIPGLEGQIIILCDDGTKVAGASAGADAYYSFMLGEGAVEIHPAVNSPLFTAVVNVDKGARATKVTLEDHYGIVIPGMAMDTDSTGNPTAAELYDTSNWSEAFSHDHRDVKLAYMKTLNG